MKKLFTILTLSSCLGIGAQTTIQLSNNGNSTTLAPNTTIALTTTANAKTLVVIDIKNTGNATHSYSAKRYDIVLNTVSSTTTAATAYFCFAGGCYPDVTFVSPNSLSLNAGQSASEIHSSNQMLQADLDEATAVGYSLVKYTFFNTANTADSVQISLEYNGVVVPTAIKHLQNNLNTDFKLYPNPSTDGLVTFETNSNVETIEVFNTLGMRVYTNSNTTKLNKTVLNLSHLNNGSYFVKTTAGNNSHVEKLIISK